MNFSSVDSRIENVTGAADQDALLRYQLEKVRESVGYVMRQCAFYRERLKNFGDCFITNIGELPFTFPNDVARFSPEMLCVGQSMVSRVVTLETSGTTAPPKRIYFTEKDMAATVDFFHHGMMEFTSEGDTVLILFPGEKEGSIGRLLAEGVRGLGARPLIYGIVSDFDDLLERISGQEINVIAGIPQQLLEFARLCRHRKISIPGLHSVLVSADYAAQSLVSAIENNLGCLVYEHYGMTEMCFGGGVYSEARDGYHMRHHDFLYEIVDPISGAILPQGEYGEVVFTSLNTEAMPLIRYRTGDFARLVMKSGRYPVMDKIKGRLRDSVPLLNGRTLRMSELEEALFKNEDVLDFRASYEGGSLLLHVRTLRFDARSVAETLLNSQSGDALSGCDVRIFPADGVAALENTMNKRSITAIGCFM